MYFRNVTVAVSHLCCKSTQYILQHRNTFTTPENIRWFSLCCFTREEPRCSVRLHVIFVFRSPDLQPDSNPESLELPIVSPSDSGNCIKSTHLHEHASVVNISPLHFFFLFQVTHAPRTGQETGSTSTAEALPQVRPMEGSKLRDCLQADISVFLNQQQVTPFTS